MNDIIQESTFVDHMGTKLIWSQSGADKLIDQDGRYSTHPGVLAIQSCAGRQGSPPQPILQFLFSIFQKTHRDKNIQKKAYIIHGKYAKQPKIMNMDLEFGCNIGWCRLP